MTMDSTSLGDLARRVAHLEAVEAILKVKHRYGELVDRLSSRIDQDDLADLGQLFTEDAEVDFVSVKLEGRKGVLALYGGQMQANIAWVWHSFHSPVIDVDGDRASARWTLQGLTVAVGETRPTTLYGRYNDELVKVDGRWQISKLQLVMGPGGPQTELQLS